MGIGARHALILLWRMIVVYWTASVPMIFEEELGEPQQWGEYLAAGKRRRAWGGNGRSVKHSGD
jgi:hypothetical protein